MLGTIKMTEFALRHFDRDFGGTKILNLEPKDFERRLNEYTHATYLREVLINSDIVIDVLDGYATFCKLLVMRNFTDARTGTLPITVANYQYLRSGYSARREGEFSVFSRWFELPLPAPIADYLILVLYDKAQLDKEAMSEYNKKIASDDIDSIGLEMPVPFDAEFGVVAILGQMNPIEEPMKPITMMRNYMDISMGGSGMKAPVAPVKPNVPAESEIMSEYNKSLLVYKEEIREINKKYDISVKFWENNATVK